MTKNYLIFLTLLPHSKFIFNNDLQCSFKLKLDAGGYDKQINIKTNVGCSYNDKNKKIKIGAGATLKNQKINYSQIASCSYNFNFNRLAIKLQNSNYGLYTNTKVKPIDHNNIPSSQEVTFSIVEKIAIQTALLIAKKELDLIADNYYDPEQYYQKQIEMKIEESEKLFKKAEKIISELNKEPADA